MQKDGLPALTDEERRDSLKSKLQSIQAQIIATPRGKMRQALGREKFRLQEEMRAIRPKLRCPDAKNHFITAAKAMLSQGQFNLVMNEAVRLSKEAEQRAADTEKEPVA